MNVIKNTNPKETLQLHELKTHLAMNGESYNEHQLN